MSVLILLLGILTVFLSLGYLCISNGIYCIYLVSQD